MKAPVLLAALFMTLLGGTLDASAAGHEAVSPNGIAPREIFIRLYPRDGYVWIRQYWLNTPLRDDTEIKAQVAAIRELVGKTGFAQSEYGFKRFRLREERVYVDRGQLTAEHHITTDERNLVKLMEDSFGRILRREIKVTITKEEIGLHFARTGLSNISSDSALGAYTKDDRAIIFWRNGIEFYEAVFTYEWDDKRYKSLLPWFGEDLASPEK